MIGKIQKRSGSIKILPALVLAGLILAMIPVSAPADVLYDNFGGTAPGYTEGVGWGIGHFQVLWFHIFKGEAFPFTPTAGQDYYLDSIEVAVQRTLLVASDASFLVHVATDNGGVPGTILATASAIAPTPVAITTVNFSGRTVLTGGNAYWVWLEVPPPHEDTLNWLHNNGSTTGPEAQTTDYGQTWSVSTGTMSAFRVNGTITPPVLPATVDLANAAEDLLIYGGTAGDGIGSGRATVAIGDVNRDGVPDIVVGSPAAGGGKGAVYVFFGDTPLTGTRDVAGTSGTLPNIIITGAEAGDALGSAVAVADMTGDGVGDLVIGAPGADGPANGRLQAGEVYLIAGAYNLPATIDIASGTGFTPVYGATAGDGLGSVITLGDITGDGRADVILGAPNADKAYVVNGAASLPASVDLSLNQQNVTISGTAGDGLTADGAVAIGDLNEDGVNDLILGAKNAGNGTAYIFYGSSSMSAAYNTATGDEDVTILGATAGDALTSGGAIAVGDINGDGTDDLVLGAFGADGAAEGRAGSGEAYVIYGSAALPPTIDLSSGGEDVTIYGAVAGDGLTKEGALKVGDITGDGIDDIVLGAMDASGGAGEAYLVKGGGLGATLDLATSADTVFLGADAGDTLTAGGGVVLADVNGDGLADVVLGAPGGDGPSNVRLNAGEAHVVYGSNSLAPSIDFATGDEDVTIYGASAGDAMTASGAMAFGDVNENGADDIILASALADGPAEGRAGAGELYVVCEGSLPASATVRRTNHSGNPLAKAFSTTNVKIDFSSGTNDSTTTVVLTRSDAGVNMILNRTANMQWQITSTRANFASSITFHYLDYQVAGLEEMYLHVYASPTLGGTYTRLDTTIDRNLNTATVTNVTGFSYFIIYESDPEIQCFIGQTPKSEGFFTWLAAVLNFLGAKVKALLAMF